MFVCYVCMYVMYVLTIYTHSPLANEANTKAKSSDKDLQVSHEYFVHDE